jgi:hypothetical protein
MNGTVLTDDYWVDEMMKWLWGIELKIHEKRKWMNEW